jgi:hypothetical protein
MLNVVMLSFVAPNNEGTKFKNYFSNSNSCHQLFSLRLNCKRREPRHLGSNKLKVIWLEKRKLPRRRKINFQHRLMFQALLGEMDNFVKVNLPKGRLTKKSTCQKVNLPKGQLAKRSTQQKINWQKVNLPKG